MHCSVEIGTFSYEFQLVLPDPLKKFQILEGESIVDFILFPLSKPKKNWIFLGNFPIFLSRKGLENFGIYFYHIEIYRGVFVLAGIPFVIKTQIIKKIQKKGQFSKGFSSFCLYSFMVFGVR